VTSVATVLQIGGAGRADRSEQRWRGVTRSRGKEIWADGERPDRRPVRLDRAEFCARVKQEAGLESELKARWMTLAVFAALKEQLSPGEAEDVFAQLPKDLKELWAEAQAEAP
jgi:hypothetical protein